jgi:ABC-type multidrug transport system ATPase subunit
MDSINVLEFDSLYLEFGHQKVLQDVYMKCTEGEAIGLLGRNGSGKSCLMKIVFGSMEAYMQSVRINGEYVTGNNIRKGWINYLPQESFIPPFLTIKKVLQQYGLRREGLNTFMPELADVHLKKINELSGGERRLLEVYIILKRPSLFSILDEPFSGLMPIHIERVIALINETKATKGIILTDHQYRYLLEVSNRIYLLHEGKTFSIKDKDELIRFGYLP